MNVTKYVSDWFERGADAERSLEAAIKIKQFVLGKVW